MLCRVNPFLPRDATESAVMLRQVRPSVTLTSVDADHIGWNRPTLKIKNNFTAD